MKIKKKIIFSLFIILFFYQNVVFSFENKIIYKLNDEIITTLDLKNEMNYLLALNPRLNELKKDEIVEISKRSVVKEKIKEIEINKISGIRSPEQNYLESLLAGIYSNIGIKNLPDFRNYLYDKNISYEYVLEKIKIEALWNELIVNKYASRIKINKNNLRQQILSKENTTTKNYLMSEILFQVNESGNVNSKYKEINDEIKKQGFENAALKYSISQTSSTGGKLDWINENSLNKNIVDKLVNLKINEHTQPIVIPGGFLILKINKIKTEKKEIDIEKELKKMIRSLKNYQFNQFSNIHFNKIKNNIVINEI